MVERFPHENKQSATLLKAALFAAKKHRLQRRRDVDASPYINHPLAVATLLAADGAVSDQELLIAALLHDTIEDTGTSPEEIKEAFGEAVLQLVAEVTDDKSLPKSERKQLQFDHAATLSGRARELKIADKICNVRDIGPDSPVGWDVQRKVEYLNWAARVVEQCRGVNCRLEVLFDEALIDARARISATTG
jgi:guanosine-3',5'-bis(diphosphate) 3'-pyrophosphohydrolase